MKFRIFETTHNGRKFEIEEDHPEVGAYLYVYEGTVCVNDCLQNDIETCKQIAYEYYKIPIDNWREKKEN